MNLVYMVTIARIHNWPKPVWEPGFGSWIPSYPTYCVQYFSTFKNRSTLNGFQHFWDFCHCQEYISSFLLNLCYLLCWICLVVSWQRSWTCIRTWATALSLTPSTTSWPAESTCTCTPVCEGSQSLRSPEWVELLTDSFQDTTTLICWFRFRY